MEVDSLQPVHRAKSAHRMCKYCVKLHLKEERSLSFPYHNSVSLGITERIDNCPITTRRDASGEERTAETYDGKQSPHAVGQIRVKAEVARRRQHRG